MHFKLYFDGNLIAENNLVLKVLSKKERIHNSIKAFVMFFALAVASVFIPVLHFFLVPVFLLTAAIMSYRKLSDVGILNVENLKCPGCQTSLNEKMIFIRSSDQTSHLTCHQCRKTITFTFLESV